MKRKIFLAILFAVIFAGCLKSPEEKLESRIKEMIELIENSQYQEFLEEYYDDDINDMWRRGGGMEAWARQFKEKYKDAVLAALKKVQTLKPDFNKNKTIALYSDESFRIGFGFYNKDGWRIMDQKTLIRLINSM